MPGKIRAAAPAVIAYAEQHKIDLTNVAGTGADGRITLDDAKNARSMPYVTPLVASLAEQHSVDLRDIEGTGIGGRIRKDDVLSAAGVLPAAAAAPPGETLQAEAERLGLDYGAFEASRAVAAVFRDRELNQRGPQWARNPLVAQARAKVQASGRAQPTAPEPTLFAGAGDLPTFTASGIPADALLQVPWDARHAMAAAPTTAEAYAIVQECASDEWLEMEPHPGNVAYAKRVEQWVADSVTDEEMERMFVNTLLPGGNTLGELESQQGYRF